MKLKYQCDNCNNNCKINVELKENKIVSIKGNKCKKGVKYVEDKLDKQIKKNKKNKNKT